MAFSDPSKVLSQILVHFMNIFLKFRLFEALEVGFTSKDFSNRQLRLKTIVAKEVSHPSDPQACMDLKIFGVDCEALL